MMNNVILINPPAFQQMESYDHPDYPSITLGYLAGDLLRHKISCRVIDAKLERLTLEDTLKRLRKWDFQLVGITAKTHEIVLAALLAEKIKTHFPDTITVIGGVHASALPRETLKDFSAFDILVVEEGEGVLPEIVHSLKNGDSLSEIRGIAFRENTEVVMSSPRPRIQNLDGIPYPAWELFPKAKIYPILTSRGCPFHCIFCMSFNGHKLRERSPRNVVEELKSVINNYHPREIQFYDETFAFNSDRAHKILDLMIEEGLTDIPIKASMRVNIIDREIVKKMKKAGVDTISCGVESGNPEMLKKMKKNITLEQVERAIKIIKQEGIKTCALFILGFPHETKETAKQTIDFAIKLNADVTSIGIMVPYPGTEVARMAARGEGGYKLLSQNWQDFNKQMGNALELENLSRKDLERLQMWGYIKIYAYNFRWGELLKLVWQYRSASLKIIKKIVGI